MSSGACLSLLALALGCSRAGHPPDAGPPQAQTHGQESDTVAMAEPAEAVPLASEPNEPETSQAEPDQAPETEPPSPPTRLAERYRLENETPREVAWLGIRNTYLVNQYVFVDGELMGWVPPNTEGRFEIPPGAHNVTLSDSRDGGSNAQILAEVFDAGYSYYYDVVVR